METPPRAWGRLAMTATMLPWKEKHPHVRGEDSVGIDLVDSGIETPPRAWGRLLSDKKEGGIWRNTPTCVGKTISLPSFRAPRGKHPHVRGEDPSICFIYQSIWETPPRAWGRPSSSGW